MWSWVWSAPVGEQGSVIAKVAALCRLGTGAARGAAQPLLRLGAGGGEMAAQKVRLGWEDLVVRWCGEHEPRAHR